MAGLNVLCNLLLILVLSVLLFERHAVQFSSSVMSGSLQLHGLQQAKLSSITNTWSLFELMYIESVMPSNHLILCRSLLPLSTFPSIRDFSSESALRIRWPKYWSFSLASVLPMNIQYRFPLGLTGLIALQTKGLLRVFSNTTVQKHLFFGAQLSLWSNSHIHS